MITVHSWINDQYFYTHINSDEEGKTLKGSRKNNEEQKPEEQQLLFEGGIDSDGEQIVGPPKLLSKKIKKEERSEKKKKKHKKEKKSKKKKDKKEREKSLESN